MSMTESDALEVLKKPTEHIRAEDDDCIFSSAYARALETAMDALEEIQQYRAIGTVSEFRELKEKATAKKPYYVQYDVNPEIGNYHCPTCEGFVLYTHPICSCGQKLDWSEGKE